MKNSTVSMIAVSTFVLTLLAASFVDDKRKTGVTAAQLEDAPLTIATSTVGRFGAGHSWHLSVNSARQAELTIDTFPNPIRKRFEVTKEQMDEFRKALVDERFFELADDYGQLVPDGSEKSLTVSAGTYSHSVKVRFLMNWVNHDKTKVREPSRAVRFLVMLRGWFNEVDAVDLRKYDQMVLDAVK